MTKWTRRWIKGLAGLLAALSLTTMAAQMSYADVTVPTPDPGTVTIDPSVLPSENDVLDLTGTKCPNPVLVNKPYTHAMDEVDPITGRKAYTWNSTIYVSKPCYH